MNTFLPHANFERAATCLDTKRLIKQSVECKQLLMAIVGISEGWKHHCVTRLWKPYPRTLFIYWIAINNAIIKRGNKPCDINGIICQHIARLPIQEAPGFLLWDEYYSRYRSHLLAKDPIFYGQYGWNEKPCRGYYGQNKEGHIVLYPRGTL